MVGERLYIVTAPGGDLVGTVARALAGVRPGEALVQLREKEMQGRALFELAAALLGVCRAAGARMVINDRVDVALAVGADGAHLPEEGLPVPRARALAPPGWLIGASAHDPAAARQRAAEGADLVLLGPIWDTPGKGHPLGVSALAAAADIPAALFAVGGIDSPGRAGEAIRAGARGVAVIRAIMGAADATTAARALVGATRDR